MAGPITIVRSRPLPATPAAPAPPTAISIVRSRPLPDATIAGDASAVRPPAADPAGVPVSDPPVRPGIASLLVPGRRHEAPFGSTASDLGRRGESLADLARPVTGQPPQTDYYTEVTAPAVPRSTGRRVADAPRAVAAGVVDVATGFWGGVRAAADIAGLPSVSAEAARYGGLTSEMSEAAMGDLAGAGQAERAVYSGLRSIGAMAPSVAAGMAGGAAVGLGLMGGMTSGQAYQRARQEGATVADAAKYAAIDGVIEMVTEKIPMSRLLGDLAQQTGVVKTILNQVVAEVPGEQVATLGQDLNEWAYLRPDATFTDYLQERPSAAADTLLATLTATLGMTGGAIALDRAARRVSSRDVVRDGVGGDAARLATDTAEDQALGRISGAIAKAQDENRRQPPPAAPVPAATPPPTTPPVAEGPPVAAGSPRPGEIVARGPKFENNGPLSNDAPSLKEANRGREPQRLNEPVADVETDMFGNPIPAPVASIAGTVTEVDPQTIHADPARFQFKQNTDKAGVTNEARIDGPWNPNRGGILLVWRDPADGQDYVINGHHRLEAAKRLGAEKVAVRYIEARDANEALIEGALTNIAEGRGTPVDVAKVVRQAKLTAEDLAGQGVSPRTALARDGLALSTLSDGIFHKVAVGEIPTPQAAAIGAANLSPEGQAAVLELWQAQEKKGRTLTPGQVAELAREAAQSAEVAADGVQGDIFGNVPTQNTAVEKAILRDWLKKELAKDRKLFGFVTKGSRAADLAKGGNVINTDASKAIADEAKQAEALFDRLAHAAGPTATAINDAAVELVAGKKPDAVRQTLLAAVKVALATEFGGRPPAARQPGGPPATRPGRQGDDRGRDDTASAGEVGSRPGDFVRLSLSSPKGKSVASITGRVTERGRVKVVSAMLPAGVEMSVEVGDIVDRTEDWTAVPESEWPGIHDLNGNRMEAPSELAKDVSDDGRPAVALPSAPKAALPPKTDPGIATRKHRYKPLLRPAGMASLPSGLKWDYVEIPEALRGKRDLPVSKFPHGIIETDRALTSDEIERFDLEPVAEVEDKKAVAQGKIAADMATRKQRLAELSERFERDGYLYAERLNGGNALFLSPSTREGVKYQVTSLENGVPVGHRDYTHLQDGPPNTNALAEFLGSNLEVKERPKTAAKSDAEPEPATTPAAKRIESLKRQIADVGKRLANDDGERMGDGWAGTQARKLEELRAELARLEAKPDANKQDETAAEATALAPEPKNPIEAHDRLMQRLRDGADVTPEELRAGLERVLASRATIIASLSAQTKDALLKRLGGMAASRYKGDVKASVVEAAYRDMIGDFVLGGSIAYNPMSKGGHEEAVRSMVSGYTEADITAYVARVAQAREAHKARVAGYVKAIKNPETLAEFDTFVRAHKQGEAGLTPEQRATYDTLRAEAGRVTRQAEQTKKAAVQAASETVGATIIETEHTRDKYPLFVVQLAARVSREDYQRLVTAAKKLGGWYSSFKGNGAVPGFQFKARASAESFQKLASEGDTAAVTEAVVERREERAEERKSAAADRLSEMADKMEEKANESLGRDRLANTARRAAMASSADASARATLSLARTLRNLAAAMREGEAKHLEGIRFRTQVEALDNVLVQAQYEFLRQSGKPWTDEAVEEVKRNTSDEVIRLVRFSNMRIPSDSMPSLLGKLAGVRGTKQLADRLRKRVGGPDSWVHFETDEARAFNGALIEAGEKGGDWRLKTGMEQRDQFARMGIEDDATLRTALREYVQFRQDTPKKDRVKELERKLAGQKVGFDFFPTPEPLARRMAEALDLAPGLRVLEPSAGKGNLADAVRAVEPEAVIETVEQSSTLREILDAKGYPLVGHDFTDFEPEELYDRIIMNPPFSEGIDADHVRKAYEHLKPGGKLVAITGEGIFFRSDKKAREFREWFDEVGGESETMDGAFLDRREVATTSVNSRLLTITKPEDAVDAVPAQTATPLQFTAENLKSAFGLTDEQAAGVMALAESMGLDTAKITIAIGGDPGDGAMPQFAGERSRLSTQMRASLATARAMHVNWRTAEEIRAVTGWFPGKYDGKLRYEVPDEYAVLTDAFAALAETPALGTPRSIRLDEALAHHELFAAYPDLGAIRVVKQRAFLDFFGATQGWFSSDKNQIVISPSATDPLSTLLHEVQHAIQDIEGFARGGNETIALDSAGVDLLKRQAERAVAELRDTVSRDERRLVKDRETLASLRAAEDRLSREDIARLNQLSLDFESARDQRTELWKADGKTEGFWQRADVVAVAARMTDLSDQIRELIGLPENSLEWAGLLTYKTLDAFIDAKAKSVQGLQEDLVKTNDAIATLSTSSDEATLRETLKKRGGGFDLYRSIAGEVEARDIQARRTLTAGQRREAAPYSSENVRPEDAIVLFHKSADGAHVDDLSRDENFRRWFGDSKVVDAQGKPLVVYHATASAFDEFDPDQSDLGSHFGTKEQAGDIAKAERPGERTIPVYLAIANPLRLRDEGSFNYDRVLDQLVEMKMVTSLQANDIRREALNEGRNRRPKATKRVRQIIEAAGYDGVVYLNREEGTSASQGDRAESDGISDRDYADRFGATDSWIAFKPTQIKSAIGNRGTFDPKNPNILYQDNDQRSMFGEDILPTGEVQPRLPEAGAVRDLEVPTPREELPQSEFRLTAEPRKPKKAKQASLLYEGEPLFQAAYHGSPHIFERFSLHAIGTGEGAQAYGWGLYFAGDKAVAEHYRKQLAGDPMPMFSALSKSENESIPGWIRNGILSATQDETSDQVPGLALAYVRNQIEEFKDRIREAKRLIKGASPEEQARSKAEGWGSINAPDPQPWLLEENIRKHEALIATLRKLQRGGLDHAIVKPGRTYKVEIPEDDDFLDYDKPLEAQSAKVRQAIKALDVKIVEDRWEAHQVTAADVSAGSFTRAEVGQWVARTVGEHGETTGWGGGIFGTREGAEANVKARQKNIPRSETGPRGVTIYRALGAAMKSRKTAEIGMHFWREAQLASEALAAQGIAGIRYLDGNSRNKSLKDLKKAFLDALPEDASFDEVMDEIASFTPTQAAVLRALKADDWLGFDYPAQAISVALSKDTDGYDISPALAQAVEALKAETKGNYNYVVFDDKLVQIMEFEQAHGQGAKASVEFAQSGEALIRALTDPEVSSPVHELSHIARRWLLNRNVPAEHRAGITDADIATAEQWAGAKDGVWTTNAEEKFARGFERYLHDGGPALPTALRSLFQKMAAWLGEVYRSVTGSAIDIEISPEMRDVYDKLVTRRERNAAKPSASAAKPQKSGPPNGKKPSPDTRRSDDSLAPFRAAERTFREVTRAYRAREIGDEEYLKGRAAFEQAKRDEDARMAAFEKDGTGAEVVPEPVAEPQPEQGSLTATLDRLEQDAKDRIKARGTFSGKRLGSGLPLDDVADLVVIGAAKLARGAVQFAAWSKTMVQEFGEDIRPHLQALFDQATERLAITRKTLDEDDYFNFRRISVSDEEKAALRGIVAETIIRTGRVPKERESWDTIREQAAALHPDMVDQLDSFQKVQAPFRAVRDAARRRINVLNQEIVKARLAMIGVPEEDLIERERVVAQKERDLQGHLDTWMRMRSEDGRNLAMHRMTVDALETWYDATFWMAQAKRNLGLPPGSDLPIDVFRALQDILLRGQQATELGQAVEPIQMELSRYLTKLRKSTWLETIAAVRKAGLLTGPKTHARNVLGNLAFATLEEVSRLPASLVDMAVSVATGHRTVHGISARGVALASREAATRGVREAVEVLRHGQTTDDLHRTDNRRELNSGIRWLDAYANFVFRTMAATDRVFKSYAFRRSMEEQAALEAINKGVSPIALLARPTQGMITRAVADAEFATFNNKNIAAEALSQAKSALRRQPGEAGKVAAFAIDMAVPFSNTPSNIIARMLDYTPAGTVKAGRAAIQAAVNGGMTAEQQRIFAQAIGRGLTGSALIYLGWTLAAAGLASGMGGEDEGDKNVRDAAGVLPGAVRIGGRWHQIATFSPAGNIVALGASMQRTATKPFRQEALRGSKMAAIATRIVLEQPMLKGLSDVVDALERPDQAGEAVLSSTVGSFVPTFVNDLASAFDPYRRDARPEGLRESLWNGAAARVPWLRTTLPARITVFGDKQAQETRAIWDPTIATVARDLTDQVLRELVSHDVGIGWPTKRPGETAADFQTRVKVTGDAIRGRLSRVVQSSRYANAPLERQAELLEDAIEDARRLVRPKTQPAARPRFTP